MSAPQTAKVPMSSLPEVIRRVLRLLAPEERRQLVFLIGPVILTAVLPQRIQKPLRTEDA